MKVEILKDGKFAPDCRSVLMLKRGEKIDSDSGARLCEIGLAKPATDAPKEKSPVEENKSLSPVKENKGKSKKKSQKETGE